MLILSSIKSRIFTLLQIMLMILSIVDHEGAIYSQTIDYGQSGEEDRQDNIDDSNAGEMKNKKAKKITDQAQNNASDISEKEAYAGKVLKSADNEDLPSEIEKMYNATFNINIKQYGYDFFKQLIKDKYLPVGDNYTVGPGDTLAIYLWGDPVDILRLNSFYKLTVDREGKIFLKNIGVFYVWGLELGKVREKIYQAFLQKFRRFEIDVTLGNIREFPVYVLGYVNKPGVVLATGINNVVDILSLAGGVAKNGSLRRIIIKRNEQGKTKEIKIDLYDFLINSETYNIRIREGDSIYVSPIGKTIGISGVVKRPAIYEIENGAIQDIIKLAGGTLPSSYSPGINLYRYVKNTLTIKDGNLDDDSFLKTDLRDGDFIMIKTLYNLVENAISVKGFIGYPGKYSYKEGLKLSQIIRTMGILPNTNIYSANIARDAEKRIIPFSPIDVIEGKSDYTLQKMDEINFYPKWINKPILVTGEVNSPKIIAYYKGITLLDVLQQVDLKESAAKLKSEIYYDDDPPINNKKEKEKTVYLIDLLVKASKEANVEVEAGARVLIRPTELAEKGKVITILGEVQNPGVYQLKPDMTLYDIMNTAGGYNKDAYTKGLIFIRRTAMKLQEEQIKVLLLSMKESLAKQQEAFSKGGSSEDTAVVQIVLRQYEQMINIIKEKSKMTLGRVALDIPSKLEELKEHPDNIILTEDDYIYVPQKPRYILIVGDVYNQMSLPYNTGKTVQYYISQVGGSSKNADEDGLYIIKASGKIISKKQFFFARSFNNMPLEEGDTVVVPTELKIPIMWRSLLKDVAQIMFQSIATAVLATRL